MENPRRCEGPSSSDPQRFRAMHQCEDHQVPLADRRAPNSRGLVQPDLATIAREVAVVQAAFLAGEALPAGEAASLAAVAEEHPGLRTVVVSDLA